MDRLVVDASVAAGWLFEDEPSKLPDAVLEFFRAGEGLVPSLFWLEVANLGVLGERRGRVDAEKVNEFFSALAMLPLITVSSEHTSDLVLGQIARLAREQSLTVYDGVYLALARRERLPLATQDQDLIRAADRIGVAVFKGQSG